MIDISLYGIAKQQAGTTTNSQVVLQGNETSDHLHYIWGQKCNGHDDINGDMQVNGTAYIDYIKSLEVNSNRSYFTYLNSTYGNIDYLNTYKLKGSKAEFDFASILKAVIGEMSAKSITTENLTCTGTAHFFELIIDKIKASGGAVIFTPANGFKVRKYEKIANGWRLYFLSEDRGEKITNMWKTNDQAICQNFNRASQGVSYNVSNKYYWSLVINTNNDDSNNGSPVHVNVGTEENIDMQYCHYIDISDSTFDGTINIEVDDEIAMLGYRGNDDPARQNAIYLSSYSSLDTDLKAPLICQYKGINDFNLSSHKYTWFSGGTTPQGEANGYRANEIRGDFKVSDGTSLEDYVNQQTQVKTYRIVASPTELVRDYEGNLSHSHISVTLLTTLQGQVNETTTVPEGTKLVVSTIKNTLIEEIETKTEGDGLSITVTDSMKNKDAIEIKLMSADGTQRLDTQRVGITDVDNSNTKIDRIVDTGTVTLMSYDGENETYSLQYQIKMLIYHYDGGSFTSITDSTSPSASDYTVRCCLVKSDQTETNVKLMKADTILSSGEYNYTSDSITWDRSTANYVYLKISLVYDSNTVDNLIIPITLTPTASLDIIQGETAKIVAQITGANEDWYNGYTYLTNYISQVSLTANENKSYIGSITSYIDDLTGQIGEKVSWSYIIQHSDEINLSVIDGLRNTGIDITSGEIKLNAENTTIIGNLNITDTNNGVTLFETVNHFGEERKIPRVNLQPKNLGEISNDLYGFYPKNISGRSESTDYYETTVTMESFSINKNDTMYIDMFTNYMWRADSSGTAESSNSGSYTVLTIKIQKDSDETEIGTVYTTRNGNGIFSNTTDILKFTASEDGTYTLKIHTRIYGLNYTGSYPNVKGTMNCRVQVGANVQTYIGVDGMYSHAGPNKLFYTGIKETRIQQGFSGIRFLNKSETELTTGNSNMQVAAGIAGSVPNAKPAWLPFYNFTPYFHPTFEVKYINVNGGNEYRPAFVIDAQTCTGICLVTVPYMDNSLNYQDSWIVLPPQTFTQDGKVCSLPVGYTITIIKNFSGAGLYVTPYHNDEVIEDANLNHNRYVGMNDNMCTRDTFIKVNGYTNSHGDRVSWISMHDH